MNGAWRTAPTDVSLGPSDVHVWCLDLAPPGPTDEASAAWLAPDEVARAASYAFDADRRRFATTRAVLRRLLARYLGRSPADLAFSPGQYGKPALSDDALHFNVAHSGNYALLAFTRVAPVGVDLERVRPLKDMAGVAASVFAPAEQVGLAALPAAQKDATFYRVWSRREAVLKALGAGLVFPPADLRITWDSAEPARVLALEGEIAARWQLIDLPANRDYAAALAIGDTTAAPDLFRFSVT